MDQEIGDVSSIGLRFHEGPGVLSRGLADEPRDRQILSEPITMSSHQPEEENPSGAPIAILERMVVGEPEVQEDCPDDGMDELPAVVAFIREVAEQLHPFGKLLGRRRFMNGLSVVSIEDSNALLVRAL